MAIHLFLSSQIQCEFYEKETLPVLDATTFSAPRTVSAPSSDSTNIHFKVCE